MKCRVFVCFLGFVILAMFGCSSPATTRGMARKRLAQTRSDAGREGQVPQHCVRASRDEILSPVVPSFPVKRLKEVQADEGRDCLVGTWTTSYVAETKTGNLAKGYLNKGKSMTTFHRVDKYFEDGTCRIERKYLGKEIVWSGEWEYRNGVFTLNTTDDHGTKQRIATRILWYGKNEFESRFADVAEYEKMVMRGGSIKSAKCRYDENGLFHAEMIMGEAGQEGAVVIVQSPMVYERE